MRNECNIIRDLLPLYVESMVSADSEEYIEEHVQSCEACRAAMERMKTREPLSSEREIIPFQVLSRKMRLQKIRIVALTAVIVLVLAVAAFSALTAPSYFPYEENLMTFTKDSDGNLLVAFAEKVTACEIVQFGFVENIGAPVYEIQAWTTAWDRLLKMEGVETELLRAVEGKPPVVYYVSNNGVENVHVYGTLPADTAMILSLPRLALVYYLIMAGCAFILLLAARVFFRKRERVKKWIDRAILLPVSYGIGHLLIAGCSTVTYNLQDDFAAILLSTLLIFLGLLMIQSMIQSRREIRKTLPNKSNGEYTNI